MTLTKRRAWSCGFSAALACLLACLVTPACSRGDFADLTTDPPSNVEPAPGSSFASDGGDGGAPEGGAVCATATVPIARTAIYMQIILDGSGSMNDALVAGGPTGLKWKAARDALVAFVDDLASKNDLAFAVGLFLFDGTKGVPEFSIPDIAMHQVDANQKGALETRLQQSTPQGGTPLGLSLEGQLPILKGFTAQAPLKANGKRVVLVITDGVPDGAADVQPAVQARCIQLVQDAFDGAPSITTFAVGVGDPASDTSTYDEVFMGKLAVAGGAPAAGCTPGWNQSSPPGQVPCHFQITPGAKTATQLRDELIAAIDAVRGAAASCEFVLVHPDGSALMTDPTRVNVVFTGSDGKSVTVPQNAADGWTYDDPADPKSVLFHGAACARVKSESDGKVVVQLGCKTVVK